MVAGVGAAARTSATPRRLAPWLWAALALLWALWVTVVCLAIPLIQAHAYDFDSYYAAAQALRFDHGANIYLTSTLAQTEQAHGLCAHAGHFVPPYVYPPLLAILLEPLTLLPCAQASVIWLLLNAMLWAASTLLLADLVARRWPQGRLLATALVTALSLGFLPAYYGLFLGQAHLLILFLITLALWLVERELLWLAGAALALGVAIKLFPALLLVYYLARGRWRVGAGAALAGMALLAMMLLWSSPATLARSLPAGAAQVGGKLPTGVNEALVALTPQPLHIVALAFVAMVGLAWLLVVWRRGGDDLLGAGWTLCVLLLVSPLVWSFYLIWLTPAFCACCAALGGPMGGGWRAGALWIGLLALAIALVSPGVALHPLATLALCGVTGALYLRSTPERSPTKPMPSVAGA